MIWAKQKVFAPDPKKKEGFRLGNDMVPPCDCVLRPIVGVGLPNPYAHLKNSVKTLFGFRKPSKKDVQPNNFLKLNGPV